MKIRKSGALNLSIAEETIVPDCREALQKAGITEPEADLFAEQVAGILEDYAAGFDGDVKVQYLLWKSLLKLELRLVIPGESFDPFTDGSRASKRLFSKMFGLNAESEGVAVSYRYAVNRNIISISVPRERKRKKLFKDPVIWGVILGTACGLICRQLPQPVNDLIIDEIAAPVQSIILHLLAGVMGPVVFISLLSSVIALESINDLTGKGFRVISRILVNVLFLVAASTLACGLIFRNFGSGSSEFSLSFLFGLIFDVIPTNLIAPFLNGNTAQIVILGFLTGAGLLLLGDGVRELKQIIEQMNRWAMSVMKIVLLTLPAIPFFSLMITLARRKEAALLEGWKFIAASYLAFTVCVVFKALLTSAVTGIGITELFSKARPVSRISLTTGSTTAAITSAYEAADSFRVNRSFTSLWVPMGSAMLSPKTAVNVVVTAFVVAQLEGVPVSASFLMVMVIMAVELAVASPGIPAACTVMLRSLGLPIDYVGLITTYRLLTDNYGSASSVTYNLFEQVEAAHKMGEIDSQ